MTRLQIGADVQQNGLKSPQYFNGRLLSAEDLRQDQETTLKQLVRIGRAVGYGILNGLNVNVDISDDRTLVVGPGIAINKRGDVVHVRRLTRLPLNEEVQVESSVSIGTQKTFTICKPSGGQTQQREAGIYLLTACPISRDEGFAPTKNVISGSTTDRCTSQWAVEDVGFHIILLSEFSMSNISEDRLRNELAHWCLGSEKLKKLLEWPFNFADNYSGLDQVTDLTEHDVPLAVFYWTGEKIGFVDMWSVRRRLIEPRAFQDWHLFASDKRPAEGEACFLQFQDQVEQLIFQRGMRGEELQTHFKYLPAVGLLPIRVTEDKHRLYIEDYARQDRASSFRYPRAFENLTYRDPIYIEGAKVQSLIRQSFDYPPIDLESGEMIWLYAVRENFAAYNNDQLGTQPYLIFASGHMPYLGDARYDASRFDYSQYKVKNI